MLLNDPHDDQLSFEIRFQPALDKIYASSSYLGVMHMESKRTDTLIVVLPTTNDRIGQMPYIVFPTHVVQLDEQAGKVELLHLTLQVS